MRLGLIGLGRIGSFHADTLSKLPAVDSLVVTDAVPAVTPHPRPAEASRPPAGSSPAVAVIAEAATLSLQQHRPVQIDEVPQP
ncbi:MAG TPA: hypothetical protein VFJ97_01415 [Dermatophilaceae bacterium]|nr:hypothetical protein [Dermatophilaceae bacterium]